MIELTKEYIDHLKDIITEKDDAKIKEILDELYPADIAELYQELDLQEAIYLYLLMDGEKAADVLMELDEEETEEPVYFYSFICPNCGEKLEFDLSDLADAEDEDEE